MVNKNSTVPTASIAAGGAGEQKGECMGVNNPVGNIPVATPMLSRILGAAWTVYLNMTEDEIKALDKEIRSVTEKNCSADIYDIAGILEDRVDKYCKRYLHPG